MLQVSETTEKIQTGLTANYVPQWTIVQALKEAMQNIAYGSVKSGKPAKLYYDSKLGLWAIKDKYTGFSKRHLYIGESEQREDEDGLGTFGEGWKIFLLVMARNEIHHQVDTVGFSFWGQMEPTPHGTDVLVINVKDNDQQSGTRVYADVPEDQWKQATKSFAVLQGIDPKLTKVNGRFPDRKSELWVQGVRIEQENDLNPLKLHYSWNLKQRNLINRDRSHVNTELAYTEIKKLIFEMPEEDVREYVSLALDGNLMEDIQRGPYVPAGGSEGKKIWLQVLADLHATTQEKLLIPSYNQAVNSQAKKKGFFLLDTPRKWDFELSYLGIRKADDVIDDQYDVVETVGYASSQEEKTIFAKVKNRMKKIFEVRTLQAMPEYRYVEDIQNPATGEKKHAHYDESLDVVYVDTSIMDNEALLMESILAELVVWKYQAKTHEDFERSYRQLLIQLVSK
jgi:hypothetical protein